jgi:hypothetical protein
MGWAFGRQLDPSPVQYGCGGEHYRLWIGALAMDITAEREIPKFQGSTGYRSRIGN